MRIFGKEPDCVPLEQGMQEAMRHVQQAVECAFVYKRNEQYVPSPEDLAALSRLSAILWQGYSTVNDVYFRLQKRCDGYPQWLADKELLSDEQG